MTWWSTALRRLGAGLLVLWLVHLATFVALRFQARDPFADLGGDRGLPAESVARLKALYGHDGHLLSQYASELLARATGDFGISLKLAPGLSTWEVLSRALPISIGLGCGALLVGVFAGLWLGVVAATSAHRGRGFADQAVRVVATLGSSLPDYVLGTALLVLVALGLGWLPVAGLATPAGLVLPVLTLCVPVMAAVARLTRTVLSDELRADFVRTARAKGADEARVVWQHALRPAIGPVIAYLAPAAAGVLTGSMVVESLFNLPGLGACFVQGALAADWPIVTGAALLYTMLLVGLNLAADVALAWLDPRTR